MVKVRLVKVRREGYRYGIGSGLVMAAGWGRASGSS